MDVRRKVSQGLVQLTDEAEVILQSSFPEDQSMGDMNILLSISMVYYLARSLNDMLHMGYLYQVKWDIQNTWDNYI